MKTPAARAPRPDAEQPTTAPQPQRLSRLRSGGWLRLLELALLVPVTGALLFPWRWLPWLGVGLAALTWILRRVDTGRFSLPTPVDGPLLTLALMGGVGYLVSVDRGLSAPRGWALLLGLILFYACLNGYRSLGDTRLLSAALALLPVGVALLGLAGGDWGKSRLFNVFGLYDYLPTLIRGLPGSGVPGSGDLINPRWIGITLGFLIPVPLALAAFGRGAWLRALAAGSALLAMLALVLTQSIQGALALAVGVFVLAVWRTRWALVLIPLGMGFLLAGLWWVGPLKAAAYALSIDNPIGIGVTLRLDMWSRAWAMIRDMPLTGVGLNTFPLMQSHFYPGYIIGIEPHTHNLYLQTLVDLGLPGLLGLIGLLVLWLLAVQRGYRAVPNRDHRALLVGLAAGVLGYYGHGLIDALMLGAKPGIFLWALLGLGLARPAGTQASGEGGAPVEEKSPLFSGWGALMYPLGAGLAALALVGLLKPAALPMNLAGLRAYPTLYRLETGSAASTQELGSALPVLESVRRRAPGALQAWELSARIHAWNGEYPAATSALEQRVLLDLADPMGRYYPPESWLGRMQGQPASGWEALNSVYTHWMNRYPLQSAHYLRTALLWERLRGDPARAARIIGEGLDRQAQPSGWLEDYLATLGRQ